MINLVRQAFRPDGGAEKAINDYMQAFAKLGWDHRLICATEGWANLPSHQLVSLGPVSRGRFGSSQFTKRVSVHMESHPDQIYQSHQWTPGAQVIRLGDGLHSTWLKRSSAHASGLKNLARNLSTFHRSRLIEQKLTLEHSRLRVIIVNSNMVAQDLLAEYPRLSSKVHVIRNLTRCHREVIQMPVGAQTFGFVGSGWERKGLVYVLKALAQLPAAQLLIAGSDSNEAKYRSLAQKLGLGERVSWLGVTLDLESIYSEIHALVHPAIYDPFPNTIIEAMAYGCPVVISDSTGAVDFSGQEGVFVTPLDYLCLAEHMNSAAQSGLAVRKELAEFVRHYDVDYLASCLEKAYEDFQF